MLIKKLLYPRTVDGFLDQLEEKVMALSSVKTNNYYDLVFATLREEYENWMELRVFPKIKEQRQTVRLVNVSIKTNNRNRERLFFRLPVVVGSRMDKKECSKKNHFCRGYDETDLDLLRKSSPLLVSYHDTPVHIRGLTSPHNFYTNVEFSLVRRNTGLQRRIDRLRMWGPHLPWVRNKNLLKLPARY